jgi:hypothetical protein
MIAGISKNKRAFLLILGSFVIAGFLTAFFLLAWSPVEPAHAATPIYVRTDGDDTLCNGMFDLPYTSGSDCAFGSITYGISQVDLGGDLYVAGGTYNESLVLNREITVTMSGNTALTGNLNIQDGTLNAPAGTLSLAGNYSRTTPGVFKNGLGTLEMNGVVQQSIGGGSVTSFHHLLINNPQNVRLDFTQSVFMTLTLQSGSLLLGSNRLELAPQAKIVGSFSASKMIVAENGSLCKDYREYDPVPVEGFVFTFPIGDRTGTPEYSPAKMTLTSGTLAEYPRVCIRVVNARMSENYFPNHLLRYWVMSSNGISDISATMQFTYTQSDVVGTESLLLALQRNGQSWTSGLPVNAAKNTFSIDSTAFTTYTAGGNAASITMDAFNATVQDRNIIIDWHTTFEENVLGFNVYRSTTLTPNLKLNNVMIPSISGGAVSPGGPYSYTDTTTSPGVLYHYWVEVVTTGGTEYFGPVDAIRYSYLFLPMVNRAP